MNDDVQELGFYTLPGAPRTPRELIAEVADGERLGFDRVFISERLNMKEAATLSGAVAVSTSRLQIAPAATNHHTRHPLVTAAYAMTMHRLTEGRFTLGLGRGVGALWRLLGLPPGHDGADRGLRRFDATTVARRDDPRPRRSSWAVSDAPLGCELRR